MRICSRSFPVAMIRNRTKTWLASRLDIEALASRGRREREAGEDARAARKGESIRLERLSPLRPSSPSATSECRTRKV
jgi:hypothetical protein